MKALIGLFAFFISAGIFAQPKLGMYPGYTITPTSVVTLGAAYGSSITVTCIVQNKGNATFSGTINLFQSVHSGSFQTVASSVSQVAATLLPNDTIRIAFIDTISPTSYKQNGNGNTIVVWPISSVATADSLFTAPLYVGTTGIKELDKRRLFLYPNPVEQVLYIKPEPGIEYKEIVIYDSQLKEVVKRPYEEKLNVSSLPPGTYIISVSDSKGLIYSARLTKSH